MKIVFTNLIPTWE